MLKENYMPEDFIIMRSVVVFVSDIKEIEHSKSRGAPIRDEAEKYLGGVNAPALAAHLYTQGLSTVEIGRQFDVNPNTLTLWLRGAGIQIRSELKGKIGLYSGNLNRIAK